MAFLHNSTVTKTTELRVYQEKQSVCFYFPNFFFFCILCAFSKSEGGERVSTPVLQGKQIQEQDESELWFPSVRVKPREM